MLTRYDEYIKDRRQGAFQGEGTNEPTSILCPSCSQGEIYANLQKIIENVPPQHPAWCKACGWNGYV